MGQAVPAIMCTAYTEYEAAGRGAVWLWRYAEKKAESQAQAVSGLIMLKCPGCGDDSDMHVRDAEIPHPSGPSWIISSSLAGITLTPSINCTGCCGWHGHLKNGVFAD